MEEERRKKEGRSGERRGRSKTNWRRKSRVTVKIQQLYLFLLSRLFSRVKKKNGITFSFLDYKPLKISIGKFAASYKTRLLSLSLSRGTCNSPIALTSALSVFLSSFHFLSFPPLFFSLAREYVINPFTSVLFFLYLRPLPLFIIALVAFAILFSFFFFFSSVHRASKARNK